MSGRLNQKRGRSSLTDRSNFESPTKRVKSDSWLRQTFNGITKLFNPNPPRPPFAPGVPDDRPPRQVGGGISLVPPIPPPPARTKTHQPHSNSTPFPSRSALSNPFASTPRATPRPVDKSFPAFGATTFAGSGGGDKGKGKEVDSAEDTEEVRRYLRAQERKWAENIAKARGEASAYQKKRAMGSLKHRKSVQERSVRLLEQVKATPTTPQEGEGDANGPGLSREELQRRVASSMITEVQSAFSPSPNLLRKSSSSTPRIARTSHPPLDRVLQTAKISVSTPRPALESYATLQAQLDEIENALDGRQRLSRKFPNRLSSEDQAIVDQTLAKASFVSELPGASVSSHDVRKLRGSQWLNDEVITFYAILINARSKSLQAGTPEERKGFKDVYSFTSFFYAKFTEKPRDGSKWTVDKGYQGVQRWTKKVDLFAKDVVIVPINLGNSHWVCAAINISQKRFEYYDSLGSRSPLVYQRLREYLAAEHLKKKGSVLDLTSWEDYWDDDVPQQENGSDCGIFTFMECLSRTDEGFDFGQEQMQYLRSKMVLEITRQEIIPEARG